MPMLRLLKRLSEKNLRKRSKSTNISTEEETSLAPPLPPPKSPIHSQSSHSTPFSSSTNSLRQQSLPPSLRRGYETVDHSGDGLTIPPSLSLPNREGIEDDGTVMTAWEVVNKGPPTATKTEKILGKLEDHVLNTQTVQTNNQLIIGGITTALQSTGGMEAIERGLNHFMEGSDLLMKTLGELGKIHPFVQVAVLAFQAVWTLEMKRRQNDKRIILLYAELKDMMIVLLQLKNVKDPSEVAPDGTSIKGRLGELAKNTADDIKDCANTCDVYAKKKLVAKIINGPIWEGRLHTFSELFNKRRGEFQFALSIHTARGVDTANQTLSVVDKTTQEMKAKMDMMMELFKKLVPPEQKEMERFIEQKGGAKACQSSEKTLKELSDFEQKISSEFGSPAAALTGAPGASGGREPRIKTFFEDLKADLRTDVDDAVKKNMDTFSRKFDLQIRQITEEIERVMVREGDRIIGAITSGPHDKILDRDVYNVWKEMNWRGSVKARHFVMCLRDSFHEKWTYGAQIHNAGGTEPVIHPPATKPDEWALTYLNVVRLQPISEAFDDDASGFVTVAEANAFTTSRPLGWSLPHWIAYWAVGWHQTLTLYANKIRDIIGKMFALLPYVKHENRNSVDEYLLTAYQVVTPLHESVNACYVNDALQARFQTYVDQEEERLKANLEAVRYDIDDAQTLTVITGPGRIERFVLPVLYLILKRHFEVIRVSQKRVLHRDELWDAADTLCWVYNVVYMRCDDLQTVFKQQKLDVKQQFKTFAHGLFEYINDPSGLWAPAIVRENDPPNYPYNDDLEEKDIKAEDVCIHPLDRTDLDLAAYELRAPDVPVVVDASALQAILCTWNGFIYRGQNTTSGMISFTLRQGDKEDNVFQAAGRNHLSDYEISGTCIQEDTSDAIVISFKRSFPARFDPQYWDGQFDRSADTITGTISMDEDRSPPFLTFILKRTPPEQLRFRPSPETIKMNKARALWTFAISATRAYVRQSSWSWSFFRERRDNRRRFIDLYIRREKYEGTLNDEEAAEFQQIHQGLTSADNRFYHSLALHRIGITPQHGVYCDNCRGSVTGARIICLDCLNHQTEDTWNSIDFCDAPECAEAEVERNDIKGSHLPSHDLVKVRRVAHVRHVGQLEREAKRALETARNTLAQNKGSGTDLACSTPDSITGPNCILCTHCIVQPCWYCVQCDDESFICDDCDTKGVASFAKYKGAHDFNMHDLVRCRDRVEDATISVEDRLAKLEGLFATRDKVMEDKLSKVDSQLSNVEKLLEVMMKKLGAEQAV